MPPHATRLQLAHPIEPPRFASLTRRSNRLGEVLVAAGLIDRVTMRTALNRRGGSNARLGEVLTRNGLLSGGLLAEALAHQWNIGRVDLAESPPDPALLDCLDVKACLRAGCIPWRMRRDVPIVVVAEPAEWKAVLAAVNLPHDRVALAIAPAMEIRACIEQNFSAALAARASTACPEEMSCRTMSGASITRSMALVLTSLCLLTIAAPVTMIWALIAWVIGFNICTTIIRGLGLIPRAPRFSLNAPSKRRWLPRVSIMVPLHKEDLVLPALLRHIGQLEYPRELMDVKLLVEADDRITRNAIEAGGFDRMADVIVVPPGPVQTKPRALNYGLNFCTGDIVGIFDAEDRPEPDQIRKVVEGFRTAKPNVAALQGKLDFYNARRNIMSRAFTVEYAIWFKVLLGGMRRLGLPIPLGGTTVYFRRSAIEALGGWDAHNVTEDADLGFRIARAGMVTEILDSVTWEEANSEPWLWVKQRSRWLKGYFLTWAVHMRHPFRLLRELGPAAFLSFQITLLGGVTSYLSMPFLWGFFIAHLAFGLPPPVEGPDWLWQAIWASLSLGSLLMIVVATLAVRRCKRPFLYAILPAMPIYWMLGAFATFKALAETLYAPFYWDKTAHGQQSDQSVGSDTARSPDFSFASST